MRRPAIALALLVLLAAGCDDGAERAEEIRRLREAHARESRALAPRPEPAPAPGEPGLDRALARMERGIAASEGRGFESFRNEEFRAGFTELAALVGADALAPAEEERVARALEAHLAVAPPAEEAWREAAREAEDALDARLAADPGDDDAFTAWRTLRRHLGAEPPDLEGLRAAASREGNPALAEAAAAVLLAAERLPAIHEGLKRDLEAARLAIEVNRFRRAHDGAWPEDLDPLRPAAVSAGPGGGVWELGPDPETDVPSIFLRGGRRFGPAETGVEGFHSGPERPLFRFPEGR